MKKLFFVFAFFTACLTGIGQAITDTGALRAAINADIKPNAVGGITASKLNRILLGNIEAIGKLGVQTLATVNGFAAFTNTEATTVFVKDTMRGGTFVLYSGANPADNGLIFADALSRKWIRTNVDAVNIQWFGAVTGGSDNRQKIIDAMAASKRVTGRVKIYIPGNSVSATYYVSDSIAISERVEIFGDGNNSVLEFAKHKKGLEFKYSGSQNSYIHDFVVACASASGDSPATWDSTRHGIIVKAPIECNNMGVSYFDGCGFYIVNDLTSAVDSGNSNTSKFFNCRSFANLLHGFFIRGGDANAMSFTKCDVTNNGGVGFYDRSFLGNHYLSNHTATNGSPELPYQRGLVKYGGTVYACIADSTIGHTPPDDDYWQDIGTDFIGYPNVLDYSASTMYWTVGSYILQGVSQYGSMFGNYAELDQAPGFIDNSNTDFGSSFVTRSTSNTNRLYGLLGSLRCKTYLASDRGLISDWVYGGNMNNYLDPFTVYPAYTGAVLGGYTNGGLLDFWHNNNRTGYLHTTAITFNATASSGKKFVITGDSVDVVGVLLNNGSPVISGANTTLSNLTSPVALNQHIIAGTDNSIDWGSSSKMYRYGYSYLNAFGSSGYTPLYPVDIRSNGNPILSITSPSTNPTIFLGSSLCCGSTINRIEYNVSTNNVEFNAGSTDHDHIFKGTTDANLLYVDAGADNVGIGINAPASKLDVNGTVGFKAVADYDLGGGNYSLIDDTKGYSYRFIYTGAGSPTIELPTADNVQNRIYSISRSVDASAGTVTVNSVSDIEDKAGVFATSYILLPSDKMQWQSSYNGSAWYWRLIMSN